MKTNEKIADALFDAYDVRQALKTHYPESLSRPKDDDDTETTVEDCLDNIIARLTELEDYPSE